MQREDEMKKILLGLAAAVSLTAGRALCAQTDTNAEAGAMTLQARQFSVMGHAGLYTPLGLGGVTVEYSALPWLVASAGAGTNLASMELSAGGKLRLLLADRMVTGFGLGFGYGQPYSSCWVPLAAPRCALPEPTPNAHAEVYLETHPSRTLVSRVYAGMMNAIQVGHAPTTENAGIVPYLGVAFGTIF
jgi:hypothetical protein